MESLPAANGPSSSSVSSPSSSKSSSKSSSSPLCSYEQLCDRILRCDPTLTKLLVDDLDDWPFMINSSNFSLSSMTSFMAAAATTAATTTQEYNFFNLDEHHSSYVGGNSNDDDHQEDRHISKIGKVFEAAADCADRACNCASSEDSHFGSKFYVREIEVRYVDLSSPIIHRPLTRLLLSLSSGNCCSCKNTTSRTWKAVRFTGCEAPARVWNQLFGRGREGGDTKNEDDSTTSLRCDELVLNHNHLPDGVYPILGRTILHNNNTVQTFKIQRETITKEKARALLLGDCDGGIPFSTRTPKTKSSSSSSSPSCRETSSRIHHRRSSSLDMLVFNFCKFHDNETVQILGDFLKLQEQQYFDHRNGDQHDRNHHHHHPGGLQSLDLGACYLRDEQITMLIRSMLSTSSSKPPPPPSSSSIQNLVLTMNSCHDYSCYALAEWLSSSSCQLKVLRLSHQQRQSQPKNDTHLSQSNTINTVPAATTVESSQMPSDLLSLGHDEDDDDESEPISSFREDYYQYQLDCSGRPSRNNDSTELHKLPSDRRNNSNHVHRPLFSLSHSCPCSSYMGRLRLEVLAYGLANNTSLKELDVSRNRLESFEITTLIDSISSTSCMTKKRSCSLEVINLTSNALGIKGLRHIAMAMPRLNGMKKLMLGNNDPDRIYSTDRPTTLSLTAADVSTSMIDSRMSRGSKEKNHRIVSNPSCLLASELLNGLKKNYTLEQILITKPDWLPSEDNFKDDSALKAKTFSGDYGVAMNDLRTLPYFLALNSGGRRLLSCPYVETGLWPVILSRAMKQCDSYTMLPPTNSRSTSSSSSSSSSSLPLVLSSSLSDHTGTDDSTSSLDAASTIDHTVKLAKPSPSPLGADVVYFLLRHGPLLQNQ
mmetsp:Transcript_16857/g.40802  ORF Transcript_16857/g.40802 Transcript_16857/m.40802 type:complete len:879 (+) Transcript_16857:396-3032(+)